MRADSLADALLDRDRRQPVAEQRPPLAAGGLVAGDEQDRAAPGPAERRVDPGLADPTPLNQRFCQSRPDTVWFMIPSGVPAIACMPTNSAASQPCSRKSVYPVHSLLHDVLAVRVEQVRDERVERPAAAGAVAVHDDDLGRARRPSRRGPPR